MVACDNLNLYMGLNVWIEGVVNAVQVLWESVMSWGRGGCIEIWVTNGIHKEIHRRDLDNRDGINWDPPHLWVGERVASCT